MLSKKIENTERYEVLLLRVVGGNVGNIRTSTHSELTSDVIEGIKRDASWFGPVAILAHDLKSGIVEFLLGDKMTMFSQNLSRRGYNNWRVGSISRR